MAASQLAAAPRMTGFLADAFAGVLGKELASLGDRRAAFAAAHILAGSVGLALWVLHWALIGPIDAVAGIGFFWLLMPWVIWILLDMFDVDLSVAEAGSAFCLSGLVIYIAAFTGGLTSPVLPWLLVAPMEAAVPGKRAPMLIAAGISAVGFALLAAIAMAGLMPVSRLTP